MSEAAANVHTIPAPSSANEGQPVFKRLLQGVWLLTWRSKFSIRRLPNLLLSLFALPILIYLTIEDGRSEPYFHFIIDFYLLLLIPLSCLSAFGAMIRDEIQTDTLRFLITRPVTRFQLYLAKYLCQLAWMQMLALVGALLVLGVGFLRHIPAFDVTGFKSVVNLVVWKFLATQFLEIMAYGALSGLLGLINQRYMVLGVVYGFVVELGIGKIPTNVNNLSVSRHLRTLLANDQTIADQYIWSPDRTPFSILMLFVGTLTFLCLASFLFTVREYHHNEEIQK